MASTTGPATVVPSIPPSVEESRAQRLQRQQARFRDRGGLVTTVGFEEPKELIGITVSSFPRTGIH
jgi:hypothetical protein